MDLFIQQNMSLTTTIRLVMEATGLHVIHLEALSHVLEKIHQEQQIIFQQEEPLTHIH